MRMSSILPKGIVVNTPGISGDIQKIDREPLAIEEIAKFWRVYTTTKRRLVDPTAERLENFWWRIWGSRKRNLRGATVARMFADISNEISFVPLRGPLNRDESGGRPTMYLARGPGTASTTAIHSRQESDSSNGRHSSSLSKSVAAMPPPILKKSRGASNAGPRPTARFISPHTSEEEEAAADDSPINGPGAQVIVRPPTPPTPVSQKSRDVTKAETSVGARKKAHGFVATATAHKRRPGVPRRPNSDPTTKPQESGSNSSGRDICKSLPEKASEKLRVGVAQEQVDIQERTLPLPDSLLSVNTSKKSRFGKSGHSKDSGRQSSASKRDLGHEAAMGSKLHGLKGNAIDNRSRAKSHEKSKREGYSEPRPATGSQSLAPRESTSHYEKVMQHRPTGHYFLKNPDGKSSISVAPTYTTVTGETDRQDMPSFESAKQQGTPFLVKDGELSLGRTEQASLFAKRPVQPVKSASALFTSPTHHSNSSMSRSKSQLTLLLERDGAKEKEHKERPDSASKIKETKPQ